MRKYKKQSFILLIIAMLILPHHSRYLLVRCLNISSILCRFSQGLNIVVGYTGLLDLGYAAFFAVGAYTTAI